MCLDRHVSGARWAAEKGHLDVVKWLGGKGPEEGGADVNQADNDGTTPLCIAALNGHVNVVKWLGGKGPDQGKADVNQANNNGCTPLYIAAEDGRLDMVKWLGGKGPEEGGADLNLARNNGWTPLAAAAYFRRPDVAKWFLDQEISEQHLLNALPQARLQRDAAQRPPDERAEWRFVVARIHRNRVLGVAVAYAVRHIRLVRFVNHCQRIVRDY